ncbi:hypothetical protein ASPFODRAFT_703899 [Aspergillus luchuensis CBS 106.47]|uniref:Uncharacterized protein n=1 Tax=Aspergillus luchuensis (strain CBS 106.47) TaxID=1137211 RepID=A0A1M3T3U3_ASPLC|nr:hypothetical protein ASPFODRAFT_703899 [Aspergillus luchuensis CBS 106.47]
MMRLFLKAGRGYITISAEEEFEVLHLAFTMDNVFEQCDHQGPYHGRLSPAILSCKLSYPRFEVHISTHSSCSLFDNINGRLRVPLGPSSQRSSVRIPFVIHRIQPGKMDREQHCMRIRQIRRRGHLVGLQVRWTSNGLASRQ